MKIIDIEVIPIDRYLFVKIHTDEGLTGLGESGAWGYLEASGSAVETFKRYLIGQDPLRIEHHWQYLYRWSHFRGAAIMGALSAIDIALWDIAGKHFGVPCYQLMGGKCRDKARVYYHVFGNTREKLIQGCVNAKEQGFTVAVTGPVDLICDGQTKLKAANGHELLSQVTGTGCSATTAIAAFLAVAQDRPLEATACALSAFGLWCLEFSPPARRHKRERMGLCRECGYDVRGQVEARCPECGTEFDARKLVAAKDAERH